MTYDPNNELTSAQLGALPEKDMFAYLDAKASYLKQFTAPLPQYYSKRFRALSTKTATIKK